MDNSEMLARLVVQAESDGGDLLMIRALVEEASETGAWRALERIGLGDRSAEPDVRDLRALLRGWQDAKKTARAAAIGWTVKLVMALGLVGAAVEMGALDLVRG